MLKNTYRKKVLEILQKSPIPMDVENVRLKSNIKSWVTSKSILLELLVEGKIQGQKTTKSWIFWNPKKANEEVKNDGTN